MLEQQGRSLSSEGTAAPSSARRPDTPAMGTIEAGSPVTTEDAGSTGTDDVWPAATSTVTTRTSPTSEARARVRI
jgi:hypothetical protein